MTTPLSATQTLSTTSLRRPTHTTTLNENHAESFVQNDLLSHRYETLPIQTGNARMPGYQGHIPGGVDVYA